MSSQKRADPPSPPSSPSKRPKPNPPAPAPPSSSAAPPPSLHAWLHPSAPPLLITHSPPLHFSNSTFLSFSIAFLPPSHITTEVSLAKEARRVVREQVRFWSGMHATLVGRKTKVNSEGEILTILQLLEAFNDDGERFGGERVLRALREGNGIDVLTVCCRWFGGDMIGPVRFQHIALTVSTSLTLLLKLVTLRDLRSILAALDEDIASLRDSIAAPPQGGPPTAEAIAGDKGKYDDVEDAGKLERLVKAREKTKASLEARVGFATLERARVEQ